MQPLYCTFIFCIVLFLYIHVYAQIKTSNDLEVFEIDDPSKEMLEEICDLKQPVLFNYTNNVISELFLKKNLIKSYNGFDINIRNVGKPRTYSADDLLYVTLNINDACNLVDNVVVDTSGIKNVYISENNSDFLEETGIVKHIRGSDAFLRPRQMSSSKYDYIIGGNDSTTPFRYGLEHRHFIMVTSGSALIKLSPPKNTKYICEIRDYENMEFGTKFNPWITYKPLQKNTDANYNYSKIKCLDIQINQGKLLYIPPYWWYSIKFGPNTTICDFRYKTFMNVISTLPQTCMRILQQHNIKRNILNTVVYKSEDGAIDNTENNDGNNSNEDLNNKRQ